MMVNMTVVTIPKHLEGRKDLIAISRGVYEELVKLERQVKSRREYKPTKAELAAIKRGRREYALGRFTTLEKLDL